MSNHSDDEQEGIAPPTIRNACEFLIFSATGTSNGPMLPPVPDDCIKIMLATDNHIGYLERDPIRGQDSINAFKEILQLAVKHDVRFPRSESRAHVR